MKISCHKLSFQLGDYGGVLRGNTCGPLLLTLLALLKNWQLGLWKHIICTPLHDSLTSEDVGWLHWLHGQVAQCKACIMLLKRFPFSLALARVSKYSQIGLVRFLVNIPGWISRYSQQQLKRNSVNIQIWIFVSQINIQNTRLQPYSIYTDMYRKIFNAS